MFLCLAFIWIEVLVDSTFAVDFRLAGTNGLCSNSGRIEVYYKYTWGTICDDSFDNTDALVACRYFGFSDGIAKGSAYYGRGSGTIWMDDLNCTGRESSLEYCSFKGWGSHNCVHSEDVGVLCFSGIGCSNLVRPSNSYLSSTNVTHGSYVTVYCYSGYTLLGDRTLFCSSGSLSGSIGTCQADCRGLTAPKNGFLSSSFVAHARYLTVSCNAGYTLSGDRTLVCSSGSLSGNIGTCEADCNGLDAPANRTISSTNVSHGNFVTVSCDFGFTLVGNYNILCSSGSLLGDIGTCESDCNGIDAPANGSLSAMNVTHGNFVIVSCNFGFTHIGNSTIFCSSGSSLGDIGTCEPDCKGLVAPENGYLSSTTVTHGDFVSVSCDVGYTLSGDKSLYCFSGSLSGNVGTCYAGCWKLIAPTHGFLSSVNVTHRDFVLVSCDEGYSLSGDKTLGCLSGSLSGEIGTCFADCDGLAVPINGSLSSTNVTHGNFVTVSCDTGYKLQGNHTLVCFSGSLLGQIGTCVSDSVASSSLYTAKAVEESTLITVASSLGAVVLVLVGVTVLQCLCFKRTQKKDQTTIPVPLTEIQERRIPQQNMYTDIPSNANVHPKEECSAKRNLDCHTVSLQPENSCKTNMEDEDMYANLAGAAKTTMDDLDEYEQLRNLDRDSLAELQEYENTYDNLQMRMSACFHR